MLFESIIFFLFCFHFRNSVHIAPYNLFLEPNCTHSNILKGLCSASSKDYAIRNIFVHSEFNQTNYSNDIALIELTEEVQFTKDVQPACLASPNFDIIPKMILSAVGFGVKNSTDKYPASIRQIVSLNVFDFEKCKKIYESNPNGIQVSGHGQFCALGKKGKDTCNGDSGGPITVQYKGITIVVGIISFGGTPCGSHWPGVYTSVSAYCYWIQNTINMNYHSMINMN